MNNGITITNITLNFNDDDVLDVFKTNIGDAIREDLSNVLLDAISEDTYLDCSLHTHVDIDNAAWYVIEDALNRSLRNGDNEK